MTKSINFDIPVERRGTNSVKWDRYKNTDILPLWVADMDFQAAPAITEALHASITQGVYGYNHVPEKLLELVVERMQRLYQWRIEPSWIVWLPGVIPGMHLACRSIGDSNSEVLLPSVIYPPFRETPSLSDRLSKPVPMIQHNSRWVIDTEWLARNIDSESKVLMFCNPHNPGGSVYTRAELTQIAELVEKHDLVIASDEIHCDLILEPGLQHIPIAALGEDIARRSVTLMSASKTFNIAGLSCSFAIIPDRNLRRNFKRRSQGIVSYVNLSGYVATLAAFEHGDHWHQQLLDYLRSNRDYLLEEINQIRGLKLDPIEATFLAWIDVSELGPDNPHQFFEQAGVGMSPGRDFGDNGFMRLNFGCSRATLEEAVSRIRKAVNFHWNNKLGN